MALYRSPDNQTSFNWPFGSREVQYRFQDGGHLGFPIRMILATFDLQVTSSPNEAGRKMLMF